MTISFNELSVENNQTRVILSWIGEGIDGDFNPADPDDEPRLRFDVEQQLNGEWLPVDDASYCVRATPFEERPRLQKLAQFILAEVSPLIEQGRPVKKYCERLSWVRTASIQ